MFLNGSDLVQIAKKTKLEDKVVYSVLLHNDITGDNFREMAERYNNNEYVPFFYKAKQGREKLSDNKKKKLRQVRISDDEMEYLGNPSTTQIRNNLIKFKQIEEFCNLLDEKGITWIPDDWLSESYNKNDPFWNKAVYSSNFNRLNAVVEDRKFIEILRNLD